MKYLTVYGLRIRHDDSHPWSEADYFLSRKERDDCEKVNRCLGGIRTHSFKEQKTEEEVRRMGL